MKKILIACICVASLASCNVKNSSEYKAVQAQRDSLMMENSQNASELEEMMEVISEVEENFNQIKEAEKYLTIESNKKSEMNRSTKTRVRDNFEMVNEILKKNKAQIAALTKRLNGTNANVVALKKTIDLLNQQLEESAKTIDELKASLTKRDKQIAELESSMDALADNVNALAADNQEKDEQLKAQEDKLYTAYYIFGNRQELTDAGVAEGGGFLSTLKITKEAVNENKFVSIDIRTTKQLPVFSKKLNLLSSHPKGSYEIAKDSDGLATLNIINVKEFWSISKFLVIEV